MSVLEVNSLEGADQVQDSLRIALPEPQLRLDQDEEWCLVEKGDGWEEIRFHDYASVYEIPGLYERLFYDILQCDSPATVRRALEDEIELLLGNTNPRVGNREMESSLILRLV